MKIREGAYYRRRRGDVVGPLTTVNWSDDLLGAAGFTWNKNGAYIDGVVSDLDLISEVYVSDTPPVSPDSATVAFKIMEPETKTLRDEFAMEAMKLLIPRQEHKDETFAELAYRQADAMMEARKK